MYQQPPTSGGGAGQLGRSCRAGGHGDRRGGHHHHHHTSSSSAKLTFDRNKFLQANYRFLVSDSVDAAAYHQNADRMFPWDDVLQVEMLTTGPVKCPISLDSPPVCPCITPCGHVFSLVAIMQHLVHHGGEQLIRWAPCPLCFEPLVARDLRLALITPVTPPAAGAQLTFQLLRRGRTTILPEPHGAPTPTTPGGAAVAAPAPPMTPNGAATAAGVAASSLLSAGGKASATPGGIRGGSGSAAAAAAAHPLSLNRWSKFAMANVACATALWREAARELADHAQEVMAEDTLDGAAQVPFVFMALEQLALRARRWTTHRAQCLADRAVPVALTRAVAAPPPPQQQQRDIGGPGPQGAALASVVAGQALDPQAQGAEAEAAVREVFMAAAVPRPATAATATGASASAASPGTPSPAPPLPPSVEDFPALAAPAAATVRGGGGGPHGGVSRAAATPPDPPPPHAGPLAAAAAVSSPSATPPAWPSGAAVAAPAPGNATAAAAPARPRAAAAMGTSSPPPPPPCPQREERDDEADFAFPSAAFSDCDDEAAAAAGVPGHSGGGEAPAAAGSPPAPCPLDTPGGAAAEAPLGKPPAEFILGTSPNNPTSVNYSSNGDFNLYQAVDGQWVFLDPLCMRCLLAYYGSHNACPATITATVLEVERVEQTEATRRRHRFLAHLPLTSTFLLAEVAVAELLPPPALAPFADELQQRQRRRRRRLVEARHQAAEAAAAEHQALLARRGPSAQELASMPELPGTLPGTAPPLLLLAGGPGRRAALAVACKAQQAAVDAEALAAAQALGFVVSDRQLAANLVLGGGAVASGGNSLDGRGGPGMGPGGLSPPPSSSTVSFANIAKLGYAATGPSLGSSPPGGGSSAALGTPQGAWASKPGTAVVGAGPAAGRPARAWGPLVAAGSAAGRVAAPGPAAAAVAPGSSWPPSAGGSGHTAVAGGGVGEAAGEASHPAAAGGGRKAGGKKGTLLFASGQRRY